jgi:rod shape-determining protein MreB
MLGKKVGIDLGTTLIRLHVKGEGVVVTEPSTVAVDVEQAVPRIVATGLNARAAARPGVELRSVLRAGAVADAAGLDALMQAALTRACGRQRIFKPDVMVAVMSEMTGADRLQVLEACARAGARTMYLIDRPLAAAIGSAVPIAGTQARLIVELGAATMDAAVIADEGAVTRTSLRRGGADLTAAIAQRLSHLHEAEVGTTAAEEVKREIASAVPLAEERTLRIRAQRAGEGVEIVVSSAELDEPVRDWLGPLDLALAQLLEEAPAPLRDGLRRAGLTLSGAGAQLRGLDRHLSAVLGLPAGVASEPAHTVARGTAIALESLEVVRRTFLYVR